MRWTASRSLQPRHANKSVAQRIVDRRARYLTTMWLDCPVEETDLSLQGCLLVERP
jgi:hypothetical protein